MNRITETSWLQKEHASSLHDDGPLSLFHVQVEGEVRSREYQREGASHRVWEVRTDSILKLDRAERQEEPVPAEAEPSDVPF